MDKRSIRDKMSLAINKIRLIKSLMAAVFLSDVVFSGIPSSNSLLEIIFTILLYLLFDKTDRMMNNPVLNQPFEFVFCAIFSLSVVLGKYLDKGQSLSSLPYLQMLSFLPVVT